jgi:hypothetical protein
MSLVGQLIGPVTGLLDKFIEDKDQKNALAHEIATMSERHAQEALKGQLGNQQDGSGTQEFVCSWVATCYRLDLCGRAVVQHYYRQRTGHLDGCARGRYNAFSARYDGNVRSRSNEKLREGQIRSAGKVDGDVHGPVSRYIEAARRC